MFASNLLGILVCFFFSFSSFAQEPSHVPAHAGRPVNTAPTDTELDMEISKFAEKHCDWPTLGTHNAYQKKGEFQKTNATPEELRADEVQRAKVHRVVSKLNQLSIGGNLIRSIEIAKESRPLNDSGELVIAIDATDAEIEKTINDSISAVDKTQNPPPNEEKIDFVAAQKRRDSRAAKLVVRLCKVRSKLGIRLSLKPWDGDDITLKEASDLVQMLESLEASGKKFKEGIRQVAVMSAPNFAAAKPYSGDKKILLIKRNQKAEDLANFLVETK